MVNLYPWLAPWLLTLFELFLVAAAAILISLSPRNKARCGHHGVRSAFERAFARLAARRRLSVLLVGFSVIAIRAALIPVLGIPQPASHDEFSYLLAGDTFAHGRITNPTHPMWIHFESFHVIQTPTYMSMYPPVQGLVLAVGQLLGHAWIGQALATALMCSALCWMLQGWLPPSWALLGGAVSGLRLGLLSYWMNGYWAASIVAFGGALVLGAWPRLHKQLSIRDAVLMALGLAILANSRPYEGLVFAIPMGVAMLFWLTGRNHPSFGRSIPRVVIPIVLTLLIASLATAYYYYRVTGNPFHMAYQVEFDTYAAAPTFLWQTPHPEVTYHHKMMHDFYQWELGVFRSNRTLAGFLGGLTVKLILAWQFYLGPLLTLPLLALPAIFRSGKMRLPLLICAVALAGLVGETWYRPDYLSPATGALLLVVMQGMRHLSQWSPARRPLGRAWVHAIPILASAMIVLRVAAVAVHVPIERTWPRGNLDRAKLLSQLRDLAGHQLVIVDYSPHENFYPEWVYNDANIDAAKVVWARDMGNDENQELLNYFRSHHVWRVNANVSPPRLESYEASQQ